MITREEGTRLASNAVEWTDEHRISTGGWQIRYREAGSGPAIVLLHGLSVSADYWWRNGPAIASCGYRVLAPDLPGFGRTAGPPGGLSIPEQAAALADWADRMHLTRALYVGHSLSCQAVLQHAAWLPERVVGLVLAAPSGDPVRFRRARQAAGLLTDAFLESWRLRMAVAQAYLRAGPFRTWQTWSAAAHHDALATAESVRAPGVVVVGTRDPVVRRGFAEALAARLPEGEVRWIRGGAHAVIFDTAEAFNAEVLRFARRTYGGEGEAGRLEARGVPADPSARPGP